LTSGFPSIGAYCRSISLKTLPQSKALARARFCELFNKPRNRVSAWRVESIPRKRFLVQIRAQEWYVSSNTGLPEGAGRFTSPLSGGSRVFLCFNFVTQFPCPPLKPQSRQSAKLFFQLSELGLPHPLSRRRVCHPSFGSGGGAQSLAREGVGIDSQFRRGDVHCGTLIYMYFVPETDEKF
jgi:hypothetical protein